MQRLVRVGLMLTFIDRASRSMARAASSFATMGMAAEQTKQKILGLKVAFAAGIGGMLVGGFLLKKALDTSKIEEFEVSMNRVRNVMKLWGTQGEENFQMLRREAIRTGLVSKYTATEMAEAMKVIGQRGMGASEAMQLTELTSQLATASQGELGLADAATVMGTVHRVMGVPVENLGKRMDQLAYLTTLSKVQFKDFMNILARAAPEFKFSEQSVEGFLAALGAIGDVGLSASRTGMLLYQSLSQLQDPKTQERLKKLGVNVLDPATKSIRRLSDIMQDLLKFQNKNRLSFGQLGTAIIAAFTKKGSRGIKAFMARGEDSVKAMRRWENELATRSKGFVKTFSDSYLNTIEGIKILSKSAWHTVSMLLQEQMLPAMKAVHKILWKIGSGLADIIDKHPMLAKLTMGILTLAGAMIFLAGTVSVLRVAFLFMGHQVTALLGAVVTPFFVSLISTIGIVAGALYILAKASEDESTNVRNYWTKAFDDMNVSAQAYFETLDQGYISTKRLNEIDAAGTRGVIERTVGITKYISKLWSQFTEGEGILSGIIKVIAGIGEALAGEFGNLGKSIKNLLGLIIKSFIDVIGFIAGIIGKILFNINIDLVAFQDMIAKRFEATYKDIDNFFDKILAKNAKVRDILKAGKGTIYITPEEHLAGATAPRSAATVSFAKPGITPLLPMESVAKTVGKGYTLPQEQVSQSQGVVPLDVTFEKGELERKFNITLNIDGEQIRTAIEDIKERKEIAHHAYPMRYR